MASLQKFAAVVKHEYKRVVMRWSFLIGTFLLPLLAVLSVLVPTLIMSIKGEPTRIAVSDPSGEIYSRLAHNLSAEAMAQKAAKKAGESGFKVSDDQQSSMSNSAETFSLLRYEAGDRPIEQQREDLLNKVIDDQIDAYLIIPPNPADPNATFEFRSRKGTDFVSNEVFTDALNEAVRSQRLADANISEDRLQELSRVVTIDKKGLDESGVEKDSDGVMIASFVIGMMIYITLAIYGQSIMAAVVEEKETRIAEILFSSARPFELMLGKLVGVGLAGLTQLAIWVFSAVLLLGFIAMQADLAPLVASIPTITPWMVPLFLVFFLLGFFLYASIFALIGSIVTTVQEGSQYSMPPIMLMLAGFYFCFAVIRDPNSTTSFWASIAPFVSPITMPVRILAETPPWWQIGLAIVLNAIAIAAMVWLTSRVYRIGMLMYGKRASIPEAWRWIRQS